MWVTRGTRAKAAERMGRQNRRGLRAMCRLLGVSERGERHELAARIQASLKACLAAVA